MGRQGQPKGQPEKGSMFNLRGICSCLRQKDNEIKRLSARSKSVASGEGAGETEKNTPNKKYKNKKKRGKTKFVVAQCKLIKQLACVGKYVLVCTCINKYEYILVCCRKMAIKARRDIKIMIKI